MPDADATTPLAQRTRIVLVHTSHPGNIGGTARAMKTMGLTRLHLVAPLKYPHADATARASGADDVLEHARVYATLDEAVADCTLVIGASARQRTLPWPAVDAREAALRVAASGEEAAIVFGPEQSGLDNRELDRCSLLLQIPTSAAYASLNLAAAVQIVAYELRMAAHTPVSPAPATPLATASELEYFYGHLQRVMEATDFLDPENPKHLMRRMRRLFNRAALDRNELNILRGLLAAWETPRARGEKR
jgi:tRNA (cytidine32/uridine32-2'-O)-methyltransferase